MGHQTNTIKHKGRIRWGMMLMEEVDCRESCFTVYYSRSLTPCFYVEIIDCGPWWLASVNVYLDNVLKSFNEPRREASCLLTPLLIAVCLFLIWFPRDLYLKKKSYYKLNTWHARQCFISVKCRCHLDGHYSELNNFLLAVPTIFTGNVHF